MNPWPALAFQGRVFADYLLYKRMHREYSCPKRIGESKNAFFGFSEYYAREFSYMCKEMLVREYLSFAEKTRVLGEATRHVNKSTRVASFLMPHPEVQNHFKPFPPA